MYKYIIWDFDGTLIDSYPEICRIYFEIISKHGFEPDVELIKECLIRNSSVETKKLIKEKYQIDENEFEKEYDYMSNQDDSIFKMKYLNNAEEVLKKLKELGIKNFVATNRNQSAVRTIENLNGLNYFEEIVYLGLNGINQRKPNPESFNYILEKYKINKEEIICIGDRDLDVNTSNNAGIDCILYKPIDGYKTKPKYVINDFTEILDIIK